jgi:hypothetical protein
MEDGSIALQEPRADYKPTLTAAERKAYQAAHRIYSEDLHENRYACPSYRRTRAIDKIAEIVMEAMAK